MGRRTLSHWERVFALDLNRTANLCHHPIESFAYIDICEAQFEKAVLLDQLPAISVI
jgi:hypothetical protein